MNTLFAGRVLNTPRSFIREILKVTQQPNVISFAGGLPSPELFPVAEISDAAQKVLAEGGAQALQYATTEGYHPLREFIAARYTANGLKTSPDQIIITSGSQQGLDLVGKLFINRGDKVVIETPGYLGAIQAFSLYEPDFHTVALLEDGVDLDGLSDAVKKEGVKFFYAVPNFQNPSGISYCRQKRKETARIVSDAKILFVEDDPYGELRFAGEPLPPVAFFAPDNVIMLGSFSKTVAPGMRSGWIRAPKQAIEKLVTIKQASDLHSSIFTQMILSRYIADNDHDGRIKMICQAYGARRDIMVESIEKYFPDDVSCTRPEGGMFLWVTLPEGVSSMEVFDAAIKKDVAFVPGSPFFVDGGGRNTLRLNFSNASQENIEVGVKRLAAAIEERVAVG